MGLKVEASLEPQHPNDLPDYCVCEIVSPGATFEDCDIGKLAMTTSKGCELFLFKGGLWELHTDDEEIRVRPLPNGTRLVVTDNEGGA